jgi:SAM-dependent methyltransferase
MSDWTAGYVSELDYTYGYYEELNTKRVELCLLNKGLAPPKITRALELGFGQGISVNVHAASSDVEWMGTDFNPGQANFAARLASEATTGCEVLDCSFEELLSSKELPEFDYIGLHGIWSWVSNHNREIITEIIRQKLRVGGVVYVSYNTTPGWAGFGPVRHLITEHAAVLGSSGEKLATRIDAALEFTEKLLALEPKYNLTYPQTVERVNNIKGQNRHYLAHEFFNKDWHPMHFSEVARILSDAKLDFAAPAELLQHVDSYHLTTKQIEFLETIPDSIMRETVRDFFLNRQFRKDYWIKGTVRLPLSDQLNKVRALRVVLTVPKDKISTKIKVGLGNLTLNESESLLIIDAIEQLGIARVGDIEAIVKNGLPGSTDLARVATILKFVTVLAGTDQAALAQEEEVISDRHANTKALNHIFFDRAKNTNEVSFLASPVTGGGIPANRIEQLFTSSIMRGLDNPEAWATEAWQILSAQGHRLLNNGIAIDTDQGNIEELMTKAKEFAENRVQIFKKLRIL